MKKFFSLNLLMVVFTWSCGKQQNGNSISELDSNLTAHSIIPPPALFNFEESKPLFQFQHINIFDSDALHDCLNEDGSKKYLMLEGELANQVLQSSNFFEWYADTVTGDYDRYYLYSIQQEVGHIGITIIKDSHHEWYHLPDCIYYCVYDKAGQLLSNVELAASIWVGGYFYSSNGRFLNDSIYRKENFEEHYTEGLMDNEFTQYWMKICIHSNGMIDTLERGDLKY